MAEYKSPGVYINELPTGHSIEGVSTDITAFVGITEKGPENTPTLITSWNDYISTFGGFLWNAYLPNAVYAFFQEGGSICHVVKASLNGQSTVAPASSEVITGNRIVASTPGEWGGKISFEIANETPGASSIGSPSSIFTFNVVVPKDTIAAINSQITSSPDKVTAADHALSAFVIYNQLTLTSNAESYILESYRGLTATDFKTTETISSPFSIRINSSSMFIRVEESDGNDGSERPLNGYYPLNGSGVVNYEFRKAYETLDAVSSLSLLGMPDTVSIVDNTGAPDFNTMQNTVNNTLTYCEQLKSLFYVIDPPLGQSTSEIMEFKNGGGNYASAIDSSYGALYYPWLWFVNPILNLSVLVPPSGAALGRYTVAPVYQSPAGPNYGQMTFASDLEQDVTNTQQDVLNPIGINAIRNFPQLGILIWGARTVSVNNEWQYLSIRRLMMYIEQSLEQGLEWVTFEPNGPHLWSSVKSEVSSFLTELWREGALFGTNPSNAYFVTCDSSNNPPENIQQGILNLTVGIAPLRPAEFVIITINKTTSSAR